MLFRSDKVAVHFCIAQHMNPGFAFADFMIARSVLCLPELLWCHLVLCVLMGGSVPFGNPADSTGGDFCANLFQISESC